MGGEPHSDELEKLFPEMTALEAPPDLSRAQQLGMFKRMALIREFELSVVDLWRKNLIYGLAHSYEGAEAIAVGACEALSEADYITSTHRGHGHTIAKGGDVRCMMAELMGKAAGYNSGKGGSMHIAAVDKGMLGATGIVASGMPIAVGAALSVSVLQENKVVLCFHGDGATNQGVWHESMNLAAAWNLPVIFLCENNQWAISCPYDRAVKNPDIAVRGSGYGVPSVTVDGFNPFAVHDAVKQARARALRKKGPSLVVAKAFRYVGHFVADDQHYRDRELVEPWRQLDPLLRMACYLTQAGVAGEQEVSAIKVAARRQVDEAIQFAEEASEPTADQLFEDLYAPDSAETE